MNVCSVEGCEIKVRLLGYCSKHYQRFKKWGTTDTRPKNYYRKYSKNDNYFSDMSLQSSYWAGLISGDGCIRPAPRCSLDIKLAIKDVSILERFKADIEWTGPIKCYHQSDRRPAYINGSDLCSVEIGSSKNYIRDLEEIYNITPAKTYTIQPPINLDEEHKLAYLVGLIDADGYIGRNKNQPVIQITTASPAMMDWLSYELGILSGRLSGAYYVYKGPINKSVDIRLGCNYARTAILKLKSVKVEKLDRKWEKYDFYIPEEDIRISNAKVHTDTAREIKASYTGERGDITRLAKEYGIGWLIVSNIVKGRTYKRLNG